MIAMSKKKPPSDATEKARYSREKLHYIGFPEELYDAIAAYAQSQSDEDTRRSLSWAARVIVRRGLKELGVATRKQD